MKCFKEKAMDWVKTGKYDEQGIETRAVASNSLGLSTMCMLRYEKAHCPPPPFASQVRPK